MKQILCHEHHIAISADARARMLVCSASGFTGTWNFVTTKPYGSQRSSGAPPGS